GIGDALVAEPLEDRDELASLAGLDVSQARSYAKVADPATGFGPDQRRATSWSVHRQLTQRTAVYDPADRFLLLRDGLTMRDAVRLTTGKEVDRRARHVMTDEEMISEIVNWLFTRKSFLGAVQDAVATS